MTDPTPQYTITVDEQAGRWYAELTATATGYVISVVGETAVEALNGLAQAFAADMREDEARLHFLMGA